MRSIDIDRAYAYCKGALTHAQRKNVEERRKTEPEFDQLIKDIEELFHTQNEAKVDEIVNTWKITRADTIKESKPSSAFSKSGTESTNEDVELGRNEEKQINDFLREQDKKKRLQKAYILVSCALIILIIAILILWYF